tara:strand:+ start:293 stop:421 length:129 start_codon:yes stop_codon:yes gene_type:complete
VVYGFYGGLKKNLEKSVDKFGMLVFNDVTATFGVVVEREREK